MSLLDVDFTDGYSVQLSWMMEVVTVVRRQRVLMWVVAALLVLASVGALWQNALRMRETNDRLRFHQELLCMAIAYHRFAEDHGVSPGSLNDIETEKDTFPQVFEMIRCGDFVVRWDAKLTGDGHDNDRYLLGYVSTAPSQGGWVLMASAGRQQVSAGEFHSLPLIPTR